MLFLFFSFHFVPSCKCSPCTCVILFCLFWSLLNEAFPYGCVTFHFFFLVAGCPQPSKYAFSRALCFFFLSFSFFFFLLFICFCSSKSPSFFFFFTGTRFMPLDTIQEKGVIGLFFSHFFTCYLNSWDSSAAKRPLFFPLLLLELFFFFLPLFFFFFDMQRGGKEREREEGDS